MACLSSPKNPPIAVALWANTPVKYYGGLSPSSPYRSVFAQPSQRWCFRRSPTSQGAAFNSHPPNPIAHALASPALGSSAPTRSGLGLQSLPSLAAGVFQRIGAASCSQRLQPLAPSLGSQSSRARAGSSLPQPLAPTPCAACTCSGAGFDTAPFPPAPFPPRAGGACCCSNCVFWSHCMGVRP